MGVWEEWGCGGVVVWEFSPPEGEGKFFASQLPLKKGDVVLIMERFVERGRQDSSKEYTWFRGKVVGNCLETKKEDKKEEEEKKERKKSKKSALEGKLGIFPCSFVVPIPKKDLKNPQHILFNCLPSPCHHDSMVTDLSDVIEEWGARILLGSQSGILLGSDSRESFTHSDVGKILSLLVYRREIVASDIGRLEEGISVKREAKELLETCRKMIGWDEQAFTKENLGWDPHSLNNFRPFALCCRHILKHSGPALSLSSSGGSLLSGSPSPPPSTPSSAPFPSSSSYSALPSASLSSYPSYPSISSSVSMSSLPSSSSSTTSLSSLSSFDTGEGGGGEGTGGSLEAFAKDWSGGVGGGSEGETLKEWRSWGKKRIKQIELKNRKGWVEKGGGRRHSTSSLPLTLSLTLSALSQGSLLFPSSSPSPLSPRSPSLPPPSRSKRIKTSPPPLSPRSPSASPKVSPRTPPSPSPKSPPRSPAPVTPRSPVFPSSPPPGLPRSVSPTSSPPIARRSRSPSLSSPPPRSPSASPPPSLSPPSPALSPSPSNSPSTSPRSSPKKRSPPKRPAKNWAKIVVPTASHRTYSSTTPRLGTKRNIPALPSSSSFEMGCNLPPPKNEGKIRRAKPASPPPSPPLEGSPCSPSFPNAVSVSQVPGTITRRGTVSAADKPNIRLLNVFSKIRMSNFRKPQEDDLVSVSVDLQRVEVGGGGGEGALSELSVFVWDRAGKVPRTETVQISPSQFSSGIELSFSSIPARLLDGKSLFLVIRAFSSSSPSEGGRGGGEGVWRNYEGVGVWGMKMKPGSRDGEERGEKRRKRFPHEKERGREGETGASKEEKTQSWLISVTLFQPHSPATAEAFASSSFPLPSPTASSISRSSSAFSLSSTASSFSPTSYTPRSSSPPPPLLPHQYLFPKLHEFLAQQSAPSSPPLPTLQKAPHLYPSSFSVLFTVKTEEGKKKIYGGVGEEEDEEEVQEGSEGSQEEGKKAVKVENLPLELNTFTEKNREDLYVTLQNFELDQDKRRGEEKKDKDNKDKNGMKFYSLRIKINDQLSNPIRSAVIQGNEKANYVLPFILLPTQNYSFSYEETFKLSFNSRFRMANTQIVFALFDGVNTYSGSFNLFDEGEKVSDKITSNPGAHTVTLQRTLCSPEEAKKSPKFRLTLKFHLLSNLTTTNRSLMIFKESGELGASNLAAVMQDLLKLDSVLLAQAMFLVGPRIFSVLDGNFGSQIDFLLLAVLVSIAGGMKLSSSVKGTVESFLRSPLFKSVTAFHKLPYLIHTVFKNLEGSDPVIKMASQSLLHGLDFLLQVSFFSLLKSHPPSLPSFPLSPLRGEGAETGGEEESQEGEIAGDKILAYLTKARTLSDSLSNLFSQLSRIVHLPSSVLLEEVQLLTLESVLEVSHTVWKIQHKLSTLGVSEMVALLRGGRGDYQKIASQASLVSQQASQFSELGVRLMGGFLKSLRGAPCFSRRNEFFEMFLDILCHGFFGDENRLAWVEEFLFYSFELLENGVKIGEKHLQIRKTSDGVDEEVEVEKGLMFSMMVESVAEIFDRMGCFSPQKQRHISEILLLLLPSLLLSFRACFPSFPPPSFLSPEASHPPLSEIVVMTSRDEDDVASAGNDVSDVGEGEKDGALSSPAISEKTRGDLPEELPENHSLFSVFNSDKSSHNSLLDGDEQEREQKEKETKETGAKESELNIDQTDSMNLISLDSMAAASTSSRVNSTLLSHSLKRLSALDPSISKKDSTATPPSPTPSPPRSPSTSNDPARPPPTTPPSTPLTPPAALSFTTPSLSSPSSPSPSPSPPPSPVSSSLLYLSSSPSLPFSPASLLKIYTVILLFTDRCPSSALISHPVLSPYHPHSMFLEYVGVLNYGLCYTYPNSWVALLCFQVRSTHQAIEILYKILSKKAEKEKDKKRGGRKKGEKKRDKEEEERERRKSKGGGRARRSKSALGGERKAKDKKKDKRKDKKKKGTWREEDIKREREKREEEEDEGEDGWDQEGWEEGGEGVEGVSLVPFYRSLFTLCLVFLERFTALTQRIWVSVTHQNLFGHLIPTDLRKSVREIAEDLWVQMGESQLSMVGEVAQMILCLAAQTDESEYQSWLADLYYIGIKRAYLSDISLLSLIRRRTVEASVQLTKSHGALAKRDTHFDPFLSRLKQCVGGKTEKWGGEIQSSPELEGLLMDLELLFRVFTDFEIAMVNREEEYVTELTIKLTRFMKLAKSYELYYGYLTELFQTFVEYGSWSQAAHALLLFISELRWSNSLFPYQVKGLPLQGTEIEVKTFCCFRALNYFVKAKEYERAFQLLDMVKEHQKDKSGTEMLNIKREAIYRTMQETERFIPLYGYVGFYGMGFGRGLRNREFVYRGHELERIVAFALRMQNQFPRAKVLKTRGDFKESMLTDPGQFVVISTVIPEKSGWGEPTDKISENIKKFRENDNVQHFVLKQTFRKEKEKFKNEFQDLWIRKTILTTSEPLPGILNRSEVVNKQDIEIGPVENAITNIAEKNQQLRDILSLFLSKDYGPSNLDRLTRSLNGVIDAEVNGGVKKYQEAFFREEYIKSQPQQASFLPQFLSELEQTLPLLENGLEYHGKYCPAQMRPLHEKMEKFFESMKERVNGITIPVVADD